jgi:hypothetical protein
MLHWRKRTVPYFPLLSMYEGQLDNTPLLHQVLQNEQNVSIVFIIFRQPTIQYGHK